MTKNLYDRLRWLRLMLSDKNDDSDYSHSLFQQQLAMMAHIKRNYVFWIRIIDPRLDNGQGKPVTQARNFYAGPCRSGQLKKSFLGDLNSLAAGDVKD